jgi:Tetracyclin repressor-like, C-terminal domain
VSRIPVIDRHKEELMRFARGTLEEVRALPVEAAVRTLVILAIEAHRVDPRLHRVLAEQIPRTGRLKNVEAFNRENYALFRAYLEGHRDEIRAVDLDLAAFIRVTPIEALSHSAVLHHPELLGKEATGALADEATRLIVRYLK